MMVVFSGLLSTFSFYIYQILQSPNLQVEKEAISFVIPRGATFRSVQDTLYKYDIVQDMVSFSFLAKLMNYTEAVKPGLYTISPDMKTPILMIVAEYDSTPEMQDGIRRLHREMDHSEFTVIKGASHAIAATHADELADRIEEFLIRPNMKLP